MMAFSLGQKVVCVTAGMFPGCTGCEWHPGEEVIEGQIYTVRRVFMFGSRHTLWLDEVARSDLARRLHGDDIGYDAVRFRPIHSTDISCFTVMLTKPPAKTRRHARA